MASIGSQRKANRALVVGVSEYDRIRPEVPDGVSGLLPAVRHNRNQLRDALHDAGLLDEHEIEVCPSPSQDVFNEALHRAADGAEGLLLFYFAGHGIVPSAGDELFLQMRNAHIVPGRHDVFPGAIQFTQVLAQLTGSRAEKIVIILDCCYAGNAAGVWQNFESGGRHRVRLLMSVQSNRLTDSGDGTGPTPFTRELVGLLPRHAEASGALSLRDLFAALKARMAKAKYKTVDGEPQEPQAMWNPDIDVDLQRADEAHQAPVTGAISQPGLWRRLRVFLRAHRWVAAVLATALAVAGFGGYRAALAPEGGPCSPPLELRVLTDPDLEPTLRSAANAYLSSDANATGGGCRSTGITVYSAGATSAVTALRKQSDAWQQPGADDDPQRDIGPQPDVWIPATRADVGRVTDGQQGRVYAQLASDSAPFAYSPVVLAVPNGFADSGADQRTGRSLSELIGDLRGRGSTVDVRRPDPEFTDTALLATIGLYGRAGDVSATERRLAQPGPPAPTAAELLCALPDDPAQDRSTAALIPEFLMKSGVGCRPATRTGRTAEYPDDVPGLEPTFVRVSWRDATRDDAARTRAVTRFHDWLTGRDGLAVLHAAGFRSASADHALLSQPGTGVLPDPGQPPARAAQAAMASALEEYRSAHGPGRVLFLLDSSGSMGGRWKGSSGGPGILEQSLGGLGPRDEYGVWAVYGTSGSGHSDLLPFGTHKNTEAGKVLADGGTTKVHDAEADPHAALLSALDYMARLGRDDDRPQLIVYLTDDEDNNRLQGAGLDEVLAKARRLNAPVAMVSLTNGGCDQGRPDALISAAGGGDCLDADDDLGPGLHGEVARAGTAEE